MQYNMMKINWINVAFHTVSGYCDIYISGGKQKTSDYRDISPHTAQS